MNLKTSNVYVTVKFYVRFSTFPSNSVRIGPIVRKGQPIFEIQDGGGRHLEFYELRILNVAVAFNGRFSTFPPNLV